MNPTNRDSEIKKKLIFADIKQINHYYPFGLNMEGNWNGAQGNNKYRICTAIPSPDPTTKGTAGAAAGGALFFGAVGGAMNYAGGIIKDYKLGSPNGILLLNQYKK